MTAAPRPVEAREGCEDRQTECRHYEGGEHFRGGCLMEACRRDWRGFTCRLCPLRGLADRDHDAELAALATARPGCADPDAERKPAPSSLRVASVRPPRPTRETRLCDRVLAILEKGPATLRDLEREVGPCGTTLHDLIEQGKAIRVCRGVYALPGQSPLDVPPAVARAAHQEVVDERIAEVVAGNEAARETGRSLVWTDGAEPASPPEPTPEMPYGGCVFVPAEPETPEPPAEPAEETQVENAPSQSIEEQVVQCINGAAAHEATARELREKAAALLREAEDAARSKLAEIESMRAKLTGDGEPPQAPAPAPVSGRKAQIVAFVRGQGGAQAKTIEAAFPNSSSAVVELVKAGALVRVSRGLYRAA